ncbi:unnamed protein product [Enterobius vermicularis]|uniref:COesterase domain-containing protein n=1 Tax=Enterobius vermicularis TaxID=51028 RepID=A0A0N4VC76_ENTVE|nr:unnamed protein product [Enterobius vermicularis]
MCAYYSVICLLVVAKSVLSKEITVQTRYGPVQGFTHTVNTTTARIFLGIPFAKPPIDDLRLEKPVEPENWTQPINATDYAAACYPHTRLAMFNNGLFSEDCLYLNIMAPIEPGENNASYAVMVWIHGGGYEGGSAASYDYKKIVENFIARDVIVVTIQYRLGFLGFFSTGTEALPGNLGLWDQTAALKFVNENIANFNGDPKRITIFGLSAGGGSTSILTLSPKSQGLFANSIQMSGSAFAEWSNSELVDDASLELAKEVGCLVDDLATVKPCLKNKTIDELLDAANRTGSTRKSIKFIKYGPRLDNDFLPEDLETLVTNASKKPTIIGVAENEGITFEDYKNYSRSDLVNFIKNEVAVQADLRDQAEKVQSMIISFYANSSDETDKSYVDWLKNYTQLLGDIIFVVPARLEAELKIQAGWPVWLYISDYYNPASCNESMPVKGFF